VGPILNCEITEALFIQATYNSWHLTNSQESKIHQIINLKKTNTHLFLSVICVTIVEHQIEIVNKLLRTRILLRIQLLLNCIHVHRTFYYAIIILQQFLHQHHMYKRQTIQVEFLLPSSTVKSSVFCLLAGWIVFLFVNKISQKAPKAVN